MFHDHLIRDGYIEDGYLAAEPGLHGALWFRYRPMLVEQREALDEAKERAASSAARFTLTAVALAQHLVEWTLTQDDGQALQIHVSTVRRLRPRLFYRLFNVVAGAQASDSVPEPDSGELVDDYAARLLRTAQEQQDADLGNCSAG